MEKISHVRRCSVIFFFFNDTATTEIYTLSLHDALPICCRMRVARRDEPHARIHAPQDGLQPRGRVLLDQDLQGHRARDRKSTRLNSSHANISYAVFCLKKKTNKSPPHTRHIVTLLYLEI